MARTATMAWRLDLREVAARSELLERCVTNLARALEWEWGVRVHLDELTGTLPAPLGRDEGEVFIRTQRREVDATLIAPEALRTFALAAAARESDYWARAEAEQRRYEQADAKQRARARAVHEAHAFGEECQYCRKSCAHDGCTSLAEVRVWGNEVCLEHARRR